MRPESPAPAGRSSGRPGMREALALSVVGHLCLAWVLVRHKPSSLRATAAASPVEVQLVANHPLAPADLTVAHEAASLGPAGPAPKPHKRSVAKPPPDPAGPRPARAGEPAAAYAPVIEVPIADHATAEPRILGEGDLGVSAAVKSAAGSSGFPQSRPASTATGDSASGFGPGSPQWESLRAAIQRRVVYPDVARRMGWQGKVIVTFVLEKDGRVRDVRVSSSSGQARLDASARQAVERAAPLPPAGEPVQIVMPIVFALR